jgi:hypothetical protein
MTPDPELEAKPQTFQAPEWMQDFLKKVLFAAVAGLFIWGIGVQLHIANSDIHHQSAALRAEFVEVKVDAERQRRIDENLTDINVTMGKIEEIMQGWKQ